MSKLDDNQNSFQPPHLSYNQGEEYQQTAPYNLSEPIKVSPTNINGIFNFFCNVIYLYFKRSLRI